MINKYWPINRGIELDAQVAQLFKKSYLKFDSCLYNQTSIILAIDILSCDYKSQLFQSVLLELEILVLDIIELNLSPGEIEVLEHKIIIDMINKSISRFQKCISLSSLYVPLDISSLFSLDHAFLIRYLLSYLVFGKSTFTGNLFGILPTPKYYIEILLDNVIIQVSNLAFRQWMNSQVSMISLFHILVASRLCSNTYISVRSMVSFHNNLIWQKIVTDYLIQPQIIYNNRYRIWFFCPYGIDSTYIYLFRMDDFALLSYSQLFTTTILELQDLFIPRLRKSLVVCVNIIFYILDTVVKHMVKLLVRSCLIIIDIKSRYR